MDRQEILSKAYELLHEYNKLLEENINKLTSNDVDLLLTRNEYIVEDLFKGLL